MEQLVLSFVGFFLPSFFNKSNLSVPDCQIPRKLRSRDLFALLLWFRLNCFVWKSKIKWNEN